MEFPSELRYSKEHEWLRVEGDTVVIGITDYAQDALGDVVFVDVPSAGGTVAPGDVICEVESTKSVSEIYAPVSGTVAAVNTALSDGPDALNSSPYGDGWLFSITLADPSELDGLLSADEYRSLVEG